jgi:hypothetical protein
MQIFVYLFKNINLIFNYDDSSITRNVWWIFSRFAIILEKFFKMKNIILIL